MLFITRKRFEEEVQRRMWEEDQKREMKHDIGELYGKCHDLRSRVERLEMLLTSGGVVKENTCDDEFFVEPPVANGKPM